MSKIIGKNLTLFVEVDGALQSWAFATTCEIDINRDMQEVGSESSGIFAEYKPKKIRWKMSAGYLMSLQAPAKSAIKLLKKGKKVRAMFATVDPHVLDVVAATQQPNGDYMLTGDVYIDRCTESAIVGQVMTWQLSATGTGPLEEVFGN